MIIFLSRLHFYFIFLNTKNKLVWITINDIRFIIYIYRSCGIGNAQLRTPAEAMNRKKTPRKQGAKYPQIDETARGSSLVNTRNQADENRWKQNRRTLKK